MGLKLEYKVTGIEGLKQRDVNVIVRDSMHSLGMRWREKFLPKHFTKAGAREYAYTPRKGEAGSGDKFKGSYSDRKLRRQGHVLPLVYFGEGRREALSSNKVTAKATRNRASVTITLPRKFNLRHPKSQVHMADEIRSVTTGEIKQLERWLVEQLEDRFRAAGKRRASVTLSLTGE